MAMPIVRIEDIMTPRSVLVSVAENELDRAKVEAEANDFEAVPLHRDGLIRRFWSRSRGDVCEITDIHRAGHDQGVRDILSRLAQHIVVFVHYRSEVVGLVDLSDLNKPLARLSWLHSLLELEQAVAMTVRPPSFQDSEVAVALGTRPANSAKKRKEKARAEDLDLPLLAFAHYAEVLTAATQLKILALTAEEVQRLNEVRKRAAHGAMTPVRKQSDGAELAWAIDTCEKSVRALRPANHNK